MYNNFLLLKHLKSILLELCEIHSAKYIISKFFQKVLSFSVVYLCTVKNKMFIAESRKRNKTMIKILTQTLCIICTPTKI